MSEKLVETVTEKVKKYHRDTVAHYKHLHQNPELSFEEENTSLYVERQLQNWG